MNQNEWVQKIVFSFYEKAKTDILIGYHFRNIQNFEEHIPRIVTFWEIQLLGKSRSSVETPFDLINAHLPLKIKKGEIGRWVVLFKKTLNESKLESKDILVLHDLWIKKLDFFQEKFLGFFGS